MEGNPNQLIRTSREGIQLIARTQVADSERAGKKKEGRMRKERERDRDGDSSEFGSQLRNKTCIKWHKSAKRRKKKSISML